MLSGKRFRLTKETVAVEGIADKQVVVLVPENGIVQILNTSSNRDQRMVEVQFERHNLILFKEDLQNRGEAIKKNSLLISADREHNARRLQPIIGKESSAE